MGSVASRFLRIGVSFALESLMDFFQLIGVIYRNDGWATIAERLTQATTITCHLLHLCM